MATAPTVDVSTFNDEQKRALQSAASLGTGINTINTSQLAPSGSLQLPSFQQTNPQELIGTIKSIPEIMTDQVLPEQQLQDTFRGEILKSLDILGGRQEATTKAEETAGIPAQQKQLMELSSGLRSLQAESLAIPLQIQEEFSGKGATMGGAEPVQTSRLRQNAIKSLSLSAQAQALQGNIALAQQQVDRAIELEFAPEERRLNFLKQAYEFNREDLERADKKRADRQRVELDERTRLLENQKSEREGVYRVMNTIASYGAPQSAVETVRNARTIGEALSLASPYMQDPQAKAALQNAVLEGQLKRLQIAKVAKETQLLGVPTPKQIAEEKEAMRKAETVGMVLSDKMTLIDAITKSSALDSVVGTSFLSRSPTGFLGTVGGVLSGVGIPAVFGGAVDKLSGERQSLIANTEQLVSKEFLDNLINVKAQGATFGALTEKEQLALTAAATKIGTWRMTDKNGAVLGYNTSEKEFVAEIGRIKEIARIAYQKATGQTFTPDEQAVFDAIEKSNVFDPSF